MVAKSACPDKTRYRELKVVLLRPVPETFSYKIRLDQSESLKPGCLVLVPLGNAKTTGFVVSIQDQANQEGIELKPVQDIIDPEPLLTPELLQLTQDVAQYYHSQWGWVIKTALPPGIIPDEIKQVVVTQKGNELDRKTLEQLKNPLLINIMQVLQDKAGDFSYADLLKEVHPQKLTLSAIRLLEDKGLVHLVYSVQHKKRKSINRFFRFALSEQEAQERIALIQSKAPKKAAVMETILSLSRTGPHFTTGELNRRFARASAYLTQLVAENFVGPVNQIDETATILLQAKVETPIEQLTARQERALRAIEPYLGRTFHVFLIHGVTGSGKTEVYLQAAEKTLKAGKDVLILVPEIGLTPAMIALMKERFKDRVALLHSGLDRSERVRQWWKSKENAPKVVLGTRSAVFAPPPNLGLIVVDEEHDPSFKQASNPSYNARDVAILRGYNGHCPVILGSATPSMESFTHAQRQKYQLLSMPERVDHLSLPPVQVIDMRQKSVRDQRTSALFTNELLSAIEQRLAQKEQTILFVPRRGYSNFVVCHACGHVPHCDRCSVSLTYHDLINALKCHYCNRQKTMLSHCPECESQELKGIGVGTERVESEIRSLFPAARVARFDTDTARGSKLYTLLTELSHGLIDILIGTQMVTKGHDFQNITLVGVIAADTTLYLPDFRAAERTFQMLAQVAGRTGRGKLGGKVIIQTYTPDHHCVVSASNHDYLQFYEKESKFRRSFRFPPFRRLATIIVTGKHQGAVIRAAQNLHQVLSKRPPEIELLGPAPAPLARLKTKYRWQLILKCPSSSLLGDFISRQVKHFFQEYGQSGIDLQVDIDPIFVL